LPELPEVETIVRGLNKNILKRTIDFVEVLQPRPLLNSTPDAFKAFFQDETIDSVGREGKYLIFSLQSQKKLVCHLRMTGKFIFVQQLDPSAIKHIRMIFHFKDRSLLLFQDVRLFGTLKIYGPKDPMQELQKTGPDLISPDFNPDFFSIHAKNRKIPVKTLLLDQTIAAGMGNIYASEALLKARIHPLKPAHLLNLTEINKLVSAIKEIMVLAISMNGTSISDYRNVDNKQGGFQKMLRAYQRSGLKCLQCHKGTIQKLVIAQRSTFFCPFCQTIET